MSDERDRRAPTDTRRETLEQPLSPFVVESAFLGDEVAILRQEIKGQTSFVESDTLPTKIDDESRAALELAGIKFGEAVPNDDIFTYVELPEGWKRKPTDNPEQSILVDEHGRKRANIHYKAAFYDRRSQISTTRRFSVELDNIRSVEEGIVVFTVTDGNDTIFSTDPVRYKSEQDFDTEHEVEAKAIDWLEKDHPDWRNRAAYWDEIRNNS